MCAACTVIVGPNGFIGPYAGIRVTFEMDSNGTYETYFIGSEILYFKMGICLFLLKDGNNDCTVIGEHSSIA